MPLYILVIDYILGVIMWTLIGRSAMNIFQKEDSQFFFMRVFVKYTNPIIKPFKFITPSFIIGPLYKPSHLNILNLPENMLDEIKERLEAEIPKSMGYLKNRYENILTYIKETTFENNITKFLLQTYERDMRRGVNATKIFPKLFEELDAYPLDKFN